MAKVYVLMIPIPWSRQIAGVTEIDGSTAFLAIFPTLAKAKRKIKPEHRKHIIAVEVTRPESATRTADAKDGTPAT